jgi:metallo-beta-lactamase family protein
LFVGYQGRGTPGRVIQDRRGWVELDGRRYTIRAEVHRIGVYFAHAGQQNLLDFVTGMEQPPQEIVLVHGEEEAKAARKAKLTMLGLIVR